jgi:hypothetical protein
MGRGAHLPFMQVDGHLAKRRTRAARLIVISTRCFLWGTASHATRIALHTSDPHIHSQTKARFACERCT